MTTKLSENRLDEIITGAVFNKVLGTPVVKIGDVADAEIIKLAKEVKELRATSFMQKHCRLPAKLVRFETSAGEKTVMLCADLVDLNERLQRYVDKWAEDFESAGSTIKMLSIEDLT